MPPWALTVPLARTSQTQFCRWLTTIRRPVPEPAGTGRVSQRLAESAYSLVRVVSFSPPVWVSPWRDWKRMTADRVQSPNVPSTGPALQPRELSRRWAFSVPAVAPAGEPITRDASTASTTSSGVASRAGVRFMG